MNLENSDIAEDDQAPLDLLLGKQMMLKSPLFQRMQRWMENTTYKDFNDFFREDNVWTTLILVAWNTICIFNFFLLLLCWM
jgi:hypothetical protein